MFDRNRVTGGGVTAGIDFALALMAAVRGEDHARIVQLALEYDPAPPFDSRQPGAGGRASARRLSQAHGVACAGPRGADPGSGGEVMAPAADRFVPPHPPRGTGPVPVWRGFFGERARTAVYGWSERAFSAALHAPQGVRLQRPHPARLRTLVQRVLLDNAANYVKPDIVKKLLTPTIGRGLLSSDGELVARAAADRRRQFRARRDRRPDPGLRRRGAAAMARLADGVGDMAARGDRDDDADHRRHPVRRRSRG